MPHRELDTHRWNLPMAALAGTVLAACGPLVIPEGETDSDSATDTDPPNPTNPTETTPGQCQSASDCQPGEDCIGGVCQPYEYYCEGGTAGCCYGDCCYGECYYYECYSDEECGPMALCQGGYYGCVFPEELPECEPPTLLPVELPFVGEGDLVSLSFVDANGDAADDLVVGRNGTTELHMGFGAVPSTLLPVPPVTTVLDATSGDFDGDGDPDLILSTADATLVVLRNDGNGTFSFQPLDQFPVSAPLVDITALQWNGDGALDVAGRGLDGAALLYLGGMQGFVASATLAASGSVVSLAPTDFEGDGFGDVVVQEEWNGQIFLGSSMGDLNADLYLPGMVHGTRSVRSAQIDPGQPQEVIGWSPQAGWLLLELFANGIEGPQFYALPGDATLAEVGDFDGDGVQDLITAGPSTLSYVRASIDTGYPRLSCRSDVATDGIVSAMATGDIDGNGRADVAYGGSGVVTVVLSP